MVIFPEKQITCCTLQALDCIMELILPFYTFSFYIFFLIIIMLMCTTDFLLFNCPSSFPI